MDDLPALPILEVSRLLGLPEELIVNILSRINSDDLARCRAVSKAFPDICTKVRSVKLLCSLDRYTNPERRPTPFKEIVTDLILRTRDVDSISIGVEERANHQPLDKELDDLHLTKESFVGPLLKRVCEGLASLSISDYRMHSHGQWSWVLFLISMFCNNLHELVLKNAWLTTDGLNPMRKLTSLTLAFVKLDDKDLSKVNSCCPSLQILKLIMVEGLEKPRINYSHLRTCRYVGLSSAMMPLINAPNLTRLAVGFGLQIDEIINFEVDPGTEVLSAPVSIEEIYARKLSTALGHICLLKSVWRRRKADSQEERMALERVKAYLQERERMALERVKAYPQELEDKIDLEEWLGVEEGFEGGC